MDELARAACEEQCVQLRAELKKWEGDWATAHGGRKPGRADIKQNPDIAHKYKQYSKLRDILAGKIPPPPQRPVDTNDTAQAKNEHHQRKRTQSDAALPPQTPSKRSKSAQTPQKTRHYHAETLPSGAQTPAAARTAMTPSANRTDTTPVPAVPTSISPTPQKDGRVLGIFDLLGRTPSRSHSGTSTLPVTTPSKPRTLDALPAGVTTTSTAITPTTARFASTPKSSKRTTQLLFTSITPLKHTKPAGTSSTTPFKTPSANRHSQTIAPPASTPTSSTPSFLRRRTISITTTAATGGGLSRVDEQENEDGAADNDNQEEEEWKKVGPLRLPRKLAGMGRGLSSVVAGLRKMEEETFGDEEEVLREMEMGGQGGGGLQGQGQGQIPAAVPGGVGNGVEAGIKRVGGVEGQGQFQPGKPNNGESGLQAGENKGETEQPTGLLSAFDEEALDDSLDEERQRQQQPLRQFKKRGQKRTTRLVNMRPTRAKRPAPTEQESDDDENEDDIVPETQFPSSKTTAAAENGGEDSLRLSDLDDSASEMDFDASDSEEGEETAKGKNKAKAKKTTAAAGKKKAATKDAEGETQQKSEGVVKRAVRKVKATAHVNFKRLKLRNTGSKGGPGHNSRFRRRR